MLKFCFSTNSTYLVANRYNTLLISRISFIFLDYGLQNDSLAFRRAFWTIIVIRVPFMTLRFIWAITHLIDICNISQSILTDILMVGMQKLSGVKLLIFYLQAHARMRLLFLLIYNVHQSFGLLLLI
jgi:hypothetical protein